MAAAYSMDLRTRVLTDADAGLSSKGLAERYHVSRAWVDALKLRRRETGSIAPRQQTSSASIGWAGTPIGGAGGGATRRDARRVAARVADLSGVGHRVACAESAGTYPQKKQ